MAWYDMVYNLAEEYGIKVIWYTATFRGAYKNPVNGETFIGRYSKFPACGGWMLWDEPALQHGTHKNVKNGYNAMRSLYPDITNHPIFPVWNYGIPYEDYANTCRPNWCELYDIGAVDLYPTALWGSQSDRCVSVQKYEKTSTGKWKNGFTYWVAYYAHTENNDGFLDCGKGMIAVIQAFVGGNGLMPCLLDQYERWHYFYGDQLKGIAFWHPDHYLGSGSNAENLRNQIKEVSRLTGWEEG